MRHPMKQHCVKAGIAQRDLNDAPRRGVATENCIDLLANGPEHRLKSIILKIVRSTSVILFLVLAGCSMPSPETKQVKQPSSEIPGPATTASRHPLAKFIELAGFRLKESSAGKLEVKFIAVNHSDADLGDIALHVRLITTASKPSDEPVAQFDAKVPSLGPHEIRDVSAPGTTKLRLFELPDWQFLRAEFDITAPEP